MYLNNMRNPRFSVHAVTNDTKTVKAVSNPRNVHNNESWKWKRSLEVPSSQKCKCYVQDSHKLNFCFPLKSLFQKKDQSVSLVRFAFSFGLFRAGNKIKKKTV